MSSPSIRYAHEIVPHPVQIDTHYTGNLRGLSALDERVAWVCGEKGIVARTLDAGKTWSKFCVPFTGPEAIQKLMFSETDRDLGGVVAFDANTAVVLATGDGGVRRTEDGGNTWKTGIDHERVKRLFLNAMAFSSPKRGYILGDPINGQFPLLVTQDGGASWEQLKCQMPKAEEGEAAFAASNSCLAVSGDHLCFGTGGKWGGFARIFSSHDAGQSWTVVHSPIPSNVTAGIMSVAYGKDSDHLVAVGGDFASKTVGGNVISSCDGGNSWTCVAKTGEYLSSVALSRKDEVIVAAGAFNCHSISITNDQTLWAVGSNGCYRRKNLALSM